MITKQVTLSLLAILFINIFLTKGKLLQSGGSDSTVNLWFASTTTSDELTSERSFFLICLPEALVLTFSFFFLVFTDISSMCLY
jgi:hypothetical protein